MGDIDYGSARKALIHNGSVIKRRGDNYSIRESTLSGFVSQLNMVPEVWRPISPETVARLIAEGYIKEADIIKEADEEE